MDRIKIGERWIGKDCPAYMIAEMSGNHAGSIERAKEIIHAAKEAGADCIKIQTYTPDTLTIDCDNPYFRVGSGTWNGENLYQLYGQAYTPWEWQGELKEEAEKVGLDFFSTPFDRTSVDFLEGLGVLFYKIASFELVDIPLIKYVASKGKPIILSTGMADLGEIEDAVRTIREQGNENIALLRCASAYPAITDQMNLRTMQNMGEIFGVPVGLSDHSMGSVGAVTAVALGAKIIEKHFCLDRAIENPDSSFSMNPEEYRQMVNDVRQAERAIGIVNYGMSEQEKSSMVFRKSVFCVEDIKKGERITEKNVRVIRPGYGLKPKHYEEILGQVALQDIKRGTPMRFEFIGKGSRVLFLTNNENSMKLYQWISERCETVLQQEPLRLEQVMEIQPDLIVSYNYSHIIPEDVIHYMGKRILNMHISYLPWNRGSSPNLWSFLDDTPKGVTIHHVSAGLDKGEIVCQRQLEFDAERETFASTYEKLNEAIVELFQENWDRFLSGEFTLKEQPVGGSYHDLKDLRALQEKLPFEWTDRIADVLEKYRQMKDCE